MENKKEPATETKKFASTADLHKYMKNKRSVNKSKEKVSQKVLEEKEVKTSKKDKADGK